MQVNRLFEISGICAAFALLAGCGGSPDSPRPATSYSLLKIADGLDQPMQYKAVPSRPDLSYLVERTGKIRILVNDVMQATELINVSGLITLNGEGGLLGIAFDPNFALNRYLYLHYSVGSTVDTQVTRFTVASNFLSADLGSARSIININQAPFTNHKGGSINFGSDGFLYLALGDGGSGDDPLNRSQDKSSLLGKLLRIDPSGDDFPTDATNNYSIPTTNPFLSDSTVRSEIWAFGLRNPFRWSVDKPTGALLIADVGQNNMEEANYLPAGIGGRNYGWRVREGNLNTANSGPTFGTTLTDPFIAFPRASAQSITGGFIYRGSSLVGMSGKYLVGDASSNRIWAVPITLQGSGEATVIPDVSGAALTLTNSASGIVSIDPDATGEPVITELYAGRISRLVGDPLP